MRPDSSPAPNAGPRALDWASKGAMLNQGLTPGILPFCMTVQRSRSEAKMRKLMSKSVGMLALVATLGPAAAADMPVKAWPLDAAIYDWTGFYIGAHGGGGWGSKDVSAPPFPFGGATITPASSTNNISGWLAGGQIGYNFQGGPGPFGGRWVIGGEAQVSWANL